MIQRVQSVLLLVAAILLVAALFFPLWSETDTQQLERAELNVYELRYEKINEDGSRGELINVKQTFYLSIFLFVGAAIALFSIFQYKNRLRQIQLGALNSLVIAASFMVGYFVYITKAEALVNPEAQGDFQLGFYLPIVALICNSIANRFIRKDENLVRSADRLR